MKLNRYEYQLEDKTNGKYVCSYTVKAGCANEAKLQKQLHSKIVQTFTI